MKGRALVVKLTCGVEAPERCSQALTVAATAAAAGARISLWLTGDSSWFAVEGRVPSLDLAHAAPAEELLAAVIAAGRVTVCTQCAARRGITEEQLVTGVRIAGAAAFVEECLDPEAQALVY